MNNVISFEHKFIESKSKQYGLPFDVVEQDYQALKLENKVADLDNLLDMRRILMNFGVFDTLDSKIEIIFIDDLVEDDDNIN